MRVPPRPPGRARSVAPCARGRWRVHACEGGAGVRTRTQHGGARGRHRGPAARGTLPAMAVESVSGGWPDRCPRRGRPFTPGALAALGGWPVSGVEACPPRSPRPALTVSVAPRPRCPRDVPGAAVSPAGSRAAGGQGSPAEGCGFQKHTPTPAQSSPRPGNRCLASRKTNHGALGGTPHMGSWEVGGPALAGSQEGVAQGPGSGGSVSHHEETRRLGSERHTQFLP